MTQIHSCLHSTLFLLRHDGDQVVCAKAGFLCAHYFPENKDVPVSQVRVTLLHCTFMYGMYQVNTPHLSEYI
jgi:hypothetical protein